MANGLTDQYQALYDAQLPQLELASRQAQQARGMFYSGNAVDAETKAKADLLAKILAQQSSDTQQSKLQQAQLTQAQSAQENATKAQSRAANVGLIGSGVGAAATLAGLYAMNKGGGNGLQNIVAGGPTGYMQLKNGVMTPVPMGGAPAIGVGGSTLAAPAAGGGLNGLAGTGPTPDPLAGTPPLPSASPAAVPGFNTTAPNGGFNMTAGAGGQAPAAAPVASMWNSPMQAAGGVAAGAAGGLGGYLAAQQVNGGGKNTALASGLGGLAGGAAGVLMSSGNPYAAGAGALLGSFGGGLLGNLFK